MEFRILGPLQVFAGGTPVEIAGSKRRALLALLLLHANEVVRTERLVDELWGEQPPRNASAALHNHVSRLRKTLGPEVLARREWGYVLRLDEDSIDLRRFERLVAAAEPLPARERSVKFAEALQLWRGSALADLASEPGLQTEIARLDELRLTTHERRIDADLEAGRNAELVGEIEALIAAHPLREHLRSQLILALYRAGRQAEALEVYRETRRVLTEELGLEPSPELRELEKAILRQDPAIAAMAPASPQGMKPTRDSRRRGVLLAAILALLLIALGLGAAFAFTGHKRAQRTAGAVSVAATTGTPFVVTTATTAQTMTQSSKTTSAVTSQPSHDSQPRRASKRPSTRVVVLGSAPAHAATRRRAATRPHAPKATAATKTAPRVPAQKPRIVTISLAEWPPGNNIDTVLMTLFKPSGGGWSVARSSWQHGIDQYTSYFGPGRDASIPLNDPTGTPRLKRRSGVITSYFLHKGRWLSLASARNTQAAALGIGSGGVNDASGNGMPFPGRKVVVDLNNFTVTATNPICPPGTAGSG